MVYKTIKQITKMKINFSCSSMVLNDLFPTIRGKRSLLIINFLVAARELIAIHWKSAIMTLKDKWLQKINPSCYVNE